MIGQLTWNCHIAAAVASGKLESAFTGYPDSRLKPDPIEIPGSGYETNKIGQLTWKCYIAAVTSGKLEAAFTGNPDSRLRPDPIKISGSG